MGGGGGVLYLIYIVYLNPVRLIQRYLVEGGDNTLPASPIAVYNIPL
jgi:hypothetical protein